MSDPDGNRMVYIAIILFLLLFNFLLTAVYEAVIALNDGQVRRAAADGDKKAAGILKMTRNPAYFMMSMKCSNVLLSLLAGGIAVFRFSGSLAGLSWFAGFEREPVLLLAAAVLLLAASFVVLLLGETVPKQVGMKHAESVSRRLLWLLRFNYVLVKPFAWLVVKSSGLLARLFGVDTGQTADEVTEEEIRMMVDVGNEKGVIEESQKEMINNVFEFDDRTAGDVMTHRTEITGVEETAKIRDIVELATSSGYSRIPVYRDDLDNITGIIYVKDLLGLVGQTSSDEAHLGGYLRPALYVPESNRCRDLFKEFTAKKVQMAVVVDEYGGTAGIVTMEDLIESIVGDIQDEYDNEEEEFSRVDETTFTIDGAADLEEVNKLLHLHLPEDGDYDTLGGFITGNLGRIPANGETPSLVIENVEFTVLRVEDRRIAKVRAHRLPDEAPEQV